MNEFPLGLDGRAWHETCRCDGPRIHHRVGSPVHAAFDCGERIERWSGVVCPELLAGLLATNRLTNQREYERLGDAHDRERLIRVPDRINIAAGGDHAHAEQVPGHPGERGVDVRVASFTV